MTEAEWDAANHPLDMVPALRTLGSNRKLRLFACACLRSELHRAIEFDYRGILEVAERMAEGTATASEIESADAAAGLASSMATGLDTYLTSAAWVALVPSAPDAAFRVADELVELHLDAFGHTPAELYAAFLRDIFGNPFRPATFDPAWRTPTATALATQMYESRDFGAMPILADALQDAGCDVDDVLNHCRDAHATHVRGCWVVDLVLSRS